MSSNDNLQLLGYSFALETDGTETFLNLRSRLETYNKTYTKGAYEKGIH